MDNGDWEKVKHSLPIEKQVVFWKPLMECASKLDSTCTSHIKQVILTVCPIMAVEVEKSIAGLKDGAPGPDRVNQSTLKQVSNGDLVIVVTL